MTAEPMKRGAQAVVHTETENLIPAQKPRVLPVGFVFEVEEHVPDGEVDGQPVEFYWGYHCAFGSVAVRAAHVKQARSAEAMAARKLPTPAEMLETVSTALIGKEEIYETERDEKNLAVTAYGNAENGLAYGFEVRLNSYWRTDD